MNIDVMDERGPIVSIIVPVYNSARYLPTLLDSLQAQSYRNLEIVCINDGSTDNSLSILSERAALDSRIVVIDKENSGAASTRNVGLDNVHGDYLCFVDSDDYVVPSAFEKLVAIAERYETDAVIFDMDNFDDETRETSPTFAVSKEFVPSGVVFSQVDIDNFYKRVVGFTVNKLYRTSYLQEQTLRFPMVRAHEDMPFTYIALSAANRLYYLDETLYYYRRSREGSLSDGTNDDYRFMLEALTAFRDGLKERGLWEKCERNYINYALHMCHWKYSVLGKWRRWAFGGDCRAFVFARFDIPSHDASYYFDDDDYCFYDRVAHPSLLYRLGSGGMRIGQSVMRSLGVW